MKMLKITLVRGFGGKPKQHRRVAEALGLRRKEHTVCHEDTPIIRGMIFKIKHMVSVEEITSDETPEANDPQEAAGEES